jgi:hypothetical protein
MYTVHLDTLRTIRTSTLIDIASRCDLQNLSILNMIFSVWKGAKFNTCSSYVELEGYYEN